MQLDLLGHAIGEIGPRRCIDDELCIRAALFIPAGDQLRVAAHRHRLAVVTRHLAGERDRAVGSKLERKTIREPERERLLRVEHRCLQGRALPHVLHKPHGVTIGRRHRLAESILALGERELHLARLNSRALHRRLNQKHATRLIVCLDGRRR